MKFTLSWLKEYLDTKASLEEICKTLTDIGLEVESVADKTKTYGYFSVAKIIEAKPHENSTKLKICQVQTIDSKAPLQIICGAANARTGIKVAYAPIGSVIPANQMVIKKAKIAGVESNGMLCSTEELELEGNSEGIIEIDDKYEIGTKITDIYGLNDATIEINVTPNRGDCLGVYGIARDLSASGIGTLKNIEITETKSQFSFKADVVNNAIEACPFAAFRSIKNVKNCESPKWLKDKLSSVGVNSISAIVDITNFVMLTLNRPMHSYDASKIEGVIDIRFAENNEKFTSLKKEEFVLDDKILLISDSKKAVGIAGIIGSNNSSCEFETNEIILESAFFNPSNIAYAGRKLSILSDARYRFERGVDINSCLLGIEFATKLILEICGGEASEIKLVGKQEQNNKTIEFDLNKIKKLIGIEISETKASEILSKLNFSSKKISENKLLVSVPSNRHDVSQVEDLIEEVIRIFGYNNVTPQKLDVEQVTNINNKVRQVRSSLATSGLIETINWSFCDDNLIDSFADKNDQLLLANPIAAQLNYMRPNLIIGLLESYRKNSLRNFSDLSLFEIGKIFLGTKESEQKLMVSGIRAGKNKEQDHYHDQRDFDIFDVKKDFMKVMEIYGIRQESLQIDALNPPKYYHPHRFAALKLGKNLIGYFGEIHPTIIKKFDLKNRVNAFEVFIDNLPQVTKSSNKNFVINDLQNVERDFAFLVNDEIAVGELTKTISNCDKQLIKEVNIFDIFSGKNIPQGKRSVALRVRIQPLEKTLTSEEIDAISKKIIDAAAKFYGATLRE
ncbi:MAG: phenylalanine--tRNA ligase subunit beta [Rickettsiales bacterium]|nr:phenylalanine--tRNA ligase subunit beta [Rickettsiales bacterium]